ncbi:FkbM family methyltransferase [Rhizobium sp. L1K21]|uniref:FkbM family methyltransferase n=1 Tax=Rhizobium sp. L1K21 TaxID=2954933 RepID=UPI002092214D|nr:FkbM family methyltransferase [Rhizobium sp. L1K21]MCO6187714.1 FkbM family methyltransferase [Rhizobium sp. L1K21]
MALRAHLETAAGMARSMVVYYGQPWRRRALRRFYQALISPDDLVFDIGAHAGSRSKTLLSLGAKVVAVEPQPAFADLIEKHFAGQLAGFERVAVGARPGEVSLRISRRHPTVTTTSPDFVEKVGRTDGFRQVRWDSEVVVPMTTLDLLIERYGIPDFCKIDCEGAEADILSGLSRPLKLVAFEYIPAMPSVAEKAIDVLMALGNYRFNRVIGESHQFHWTDWQDGTHLRRDLAALGPESGSGDIYARLEC